MDQETVFRFFTFSLKKCCVITAWLKGHQTAQSIAYAVHDNTQLHIYLDNYTRSLTGYNDKYWHPDRRAHVHD